MHDTADGVESNCYARPLNAEGPVDNRCKNDAVTWVFTPEGVRRYICTGHVDEVCRNGEPDDEHPQVRECTRCYRLTPVDQLSVYNVCDECQQ